MTYTNNRFATVEIECRVFNEKALWRAAYGRMEEETGTQDQEYVESILGTINDPLIGACLQVLLDPGSSPAPHAFEIIESHAS